MLLKEIQQECLTNSKQWFPEVAESITHHVLALAGEVGELANLIKKHERGSLDWDGKFQHEVAQETVDVFIYLCNIAELIGLDLEEGYVRKQRFNASRF